MLKRFVDALFGAPATSAGREPLCIQLATCVILLQAARADGDFTTDERAYITTALKERFDLDDGEVEELIAEGDRARDESSDLWRFTNTINQTFTVDEKKAVVEEVWRIVYSDGELGAHEDHLLHKLQQLLHLNHPTLIEMKLKVLEELRA